MDFVAEVGATHPEDIVTIAAIGEDYPKLVAELRKLSFHKAVTTFAGLLTEPDLQANCFRLEALVHLAIVHCQGRGDPSEAFVRRSFDQLTAGYCGLVEDPAENVFVTLVNTPEGNFRVFEGLGKGNGFYLQRVLNIIDAMPRRAPFLAIRQAATGLLKLSDEVAARARLTENQLGSELPKREIPSAIAARTRLYRQRVRFGEPDLKRLGLSKALLSDFIFDPDSRDELPEQEIGHTNLERQPLIVFGEDLYLSIPTAVGSAITRFLLERVRVLRLDEALESALAREYGEFLDETPVLDHQTQQHLPVKPVSGGWLAPAMAEVDTGRWLHLIFVTDDLRGFSGRGFNGYGEIPDRLIELIERGINEGAERAQTSADFRDGIVLIVNCGIGRGYSFAMKNKLPEGWTIESVPCHDYATLSWFHDFNSLSLWRLNEATAALSRQGVTLLNASGLLNLVGWAKRMNGHVVAHREMPDNFVADGAAGILPIPSNCNRSIRHSVLAEWNPRRVLDLDGTFVPVRKLGRSRFEEDNYATTYAAIEDMPSGRLRAVHLTKTRAWWIEIGYPECAAKDVAFEMGKVLCAWLEKSARILEDNLPSLPDGPLSIFVKFDAISGVISNTVIPKNEDELRAIISVTASHGSPAIRLDVGREFEDGLAQPENVAERVLIEFVVTGAALAAGADYDLERLRAIADRVCPDRDARWMHRFETRLFRDFVRDQLTHDPVLPDPLDHGTCSLGVGWRARTRDEGNEVVGVQSCTTYLNEVVRVVLDDLCEGLRGFNRALFLKAVLHNYEVAVYDREHWRRTSRALIATHTDQEAARKTIVEHNSGLNSCAIASRILMEAAICECPIDGAGVPGRLDLSRLLAKVMYAFQMGGWSDAVYWGAMQPLVRITALGDVQMSHHFIENVYQPFGHVGGKANVAKAAEDYPSLYGRSVGSATFESVFGVKFLDAWKAEFGVSLQDLFSFVQVLEQQGIAARREFVEISRSRLVSILSEGAKVTPERALATLSLFVSTPRPAWRSAPIGFRDKDWSPWRFRRRLAILRRPFLQLDVVEDPTVICAPGLILDSFQSLVTWYRKGEIVSSEPQSTEMRQWIGHINNVQRHAFSPVVLERMRELGWKADKELKLPHILQQNLPKDYGDVDVLAWNPETGRVLAMECKDLQTHTTLGEVAEQLTDFRGEIRNGKPDRLKVHLDRLEVLKTHEKAVAKFLKISIPIQIEGHLVFRNPVPMKFAWDQMADRIHLSLFDDLAGI